jgi:septum formation protein
MMYEKLTGKKLVLASASPRRKLLLEGLMLPFEVRPTDSNEDFDDTLRAGDIALFLAEKKARHAFTAAAADELILAADTIVWLHNRVLNKPLDEAEAFDMLRGLSGQTHTVYTGVCLLSANKERSFTDATRVHFSTLTEEEIAFYVRTFKPYDKAGAYGAQDWIGLVGIDRLEGSYFNVMGLPVHRIYRELLAGGW